MNCLVCVVFIFVSTICVVIRAKSVISKFWVKILFLLILLFLLTLTSNRYFYRSQLTITTITLLYTECADETDSRSHLTLFHRSGLQVGDLESDTEDLLVTRDEFAGRLRDSSDRIGRMDGEIDSLKGILNRQNIEMEILRKQVLDNKGVHNTYITHGTQQSTSSRVIISEAQQQPPVLHPAATLTPAPTPTTVVEPLSAKATPPPEKPEKKNKVLFTQVEDASAPLRPVAAAAAAPVPQMQPAAVEEVPVLKELLDDGCVDIIFPFVHNPDLTPGARSTLNASQGTPSIAALLSVSQKLVQESDEKTQSLCVRLLKDISVEDLVFELRHFIATKSCVPLNRVALVLNKKVKRAFQ